MKKIISLIIAVLLLVSCFGFTAYCTEIPDTVDDSFVEGETVYADLPADEVITFSEDFKELYCGEGVFVRCPAEDMNVDTSAKIENKVKFDKEIVSEIDFYANEQGTIIEAEIYYTDGATLWVTYMRNDYLDEYKSILEGEKKEYEIDFSFQEKNIVKANVEKLKGKKTKLKNQTYYWEPTYYINCNVSDGSFGICVGELCISGEECYYIDYAELGDIAEKLGMGEYEKDFTAYLIEDTALIEEIKAAEKKYNSELDYGMLFDEEVTEGIAKIFFVVFFVVIPFVILVFGLIFTFRSKKTIYKKMFAVISALAVLEIIIFTIVSIILL